MIDAFIKNVFVDNATDTGVTSVAKLVTRVRMEQPQQYLLDQSTGISYAIVPEVITIFTKQHNMFNYIIVYILNVDLILVTSNHRHIKSHYND